MVFGHNGVLGADVLRRAAAPGEPDTEHVIILLPATEERTVPATALSLCIVMFHNIVQVSQNSSFLFTFGTFF